jgi:hypothetical protein
MNNTECYFELVSNRAIYKDGWMASTTPLRLPWVTHVGNEPNPDDFKWELYNIVSALSGRFSSSHFRIASYSVGPRRSARHNPSLTSSEKILKHLSRV